MTKSTTTNFKLFFWLLLFSIVVFNACSSDVDLEEVGEEEQEQEIEEEDPPMEVLTLSDIFPRKGKLPNSQNTISMNQNGEYFLIGLDYKDPYCIEVPPPYDYISCESEGVFLYKFDSDGTLLWEQNWEKEEAIVVLATSDGGCYLGTDEGNIIIRKINAAGDEVWKTDMGGDEKDYLYDFTLNSEDGLICTGRTNNFGAGSLGDIWTFQLSQNGYEEWSDIYLDEDQEIPHTIISTQDGGSLVIGENADKQIDPVLILLKYSQQGELLWVKNYQLNDWTIGTSAVETDDGHVIITGRVYKNMSYSNLLIMKVDPSGNIVWNKEIDNLEHSERGNNVYEGNNGEIIVLGVSNGVGFLVTFDQSGNQLSLDTVDDSRIYFLTMVSQNSSSRTLFYNALVETPDTLFEYIKSVEVLQ